MAANIKVESNVISMNKLVNSMCTFARQFIMYTSYLEVERKINEVK